MGTAIQPILALRDISKSFGGVSALDGVSMDLAAGQIHALLGANGSGKSSLVKIMTGVYQPDSGTLEFDGKNYKNFSSPAEASKLGIRVVHQEAPLIDTLNVMEAVATFRGYGVPRLGSIKWKKLERRVQKLLDDMDVPIRATQSCGEIGPADRAGLALAIIVGDLFEDTEAAKSVKLLIVDEVTAAIHESETEKHLERLRKIADKGVAVLMITHRLRELHLADDISILRGGSLAYRENGAQRLSYREIVEYMVSFHPEVGTKAEPSSSYVNQPQDVLGDYNSKTDFSTIWGSPVVEGADLEPHAQDAILVRDLDGSILSKLNFTARRGEIVGFAGLRGSGVEELPRILSGDAQRLGGSIIVSGKELNQRCSPSEIIDSGMVAIPADRLRAGGIGSFDVRENIILPRLGSYWHQPQKWKDVVTSVITSFGVEPQIPKRLFRNFSGGNQQKILLGKWLLLKPKVFVLDDPTYGVDPAARETIFNALTDAARRGACVLFFSSEPEQLVRVCDRILVLGNGNIVKELAGVDKTLETVTEWSYQ